jgi:hypothetical protein
MSRNSAPSREMRVMMSTDANVANTEPAPRPTCEVTSYYEQGSRWFGFGKCWNYTLTFSAPVSTKLFEYLEALLPVEESFDGDMSSSEHCHVRTTKVGGIELTGGQQVRFSFDGGYEIRKAHDLRREVGKLLTMLALDENGRVTYISQYL